MSRSEGLPLDDVLPEGFRYQADFLTAADETALAADISRIEFSAFEMRGVVARRRVAFFGRSYDARGVAPLPLPAFLQALRDRVAAWSGLEARAFVMALVNEYPPGAPIGWHRDAPQYDIVAGVSLLTECRMKFRPYVRPDQQPATPGRQRTATHQIALAPRSVYLLAGPARQAFEHHIPSVPSLRYSITFRTARARS